jgi:hypothetical protein
MKRQKYFGNISTKGFPGKKVSDEMHSKKHSSTEFLIWGFNI